MISSRKKNISGESGFRFSRILPSSFAGSWYPGDPQELTRMLEGFMEEQPPLCEEPPFAVIVPHAGYIYSGKTAMKAYQQLCGHSFRRVLILAPSHRAYFRNQVCIPESDGVTTPFGIVNFDAEAIAQLRQYPFIGASDKIQQGEHSAQLQFPFLQYILRNHFKVVPLILGDLDEEHKQLFITALQDLLEAGTLLVVSSDFVHYGRNYDYVPFTENIRENLDNLNLGAWRFIENKDSAGFMDYVQQTGATICGAGPIEILLRLLPEKTRVFKTDYTDSSAETGFISGCVSYLSAVFCGKTSPEKHLTEQDKSILLKLARSVIAQQFNSSEDLPDLSSLSAAVRERAGAFVTLKINGELRGCIGEILPYRPLINAVRSRAVDAAFHDPRFYPLREEELSRIHIEISALTPPHPVKSWQEIELGKHGILLQKGNAGAVFLPQVPGEQGWNLPETLSYLSEKAGLPRDAWKEDCSFQVFEAVVFGEAE